MMEMKKYKLSEIAKNITDGEHGTVIDDITGTYYLLSNKNIINGQILINPKTDRRINKETFDKINKRTKLEKGDVLISTVGTLGKTCIVEEKINYTLQRSVGIIKPNLDVLKSKYLMYLLMTDFYQNLLINNSKGAVQKCIFIDDLKQLPIQIPSLPTQQKIAAILSSLDDKIALNKKINAKLEAMAKRLYDYWFVQFDYPDKNGKPYKTSGGKMVWNEVLKRKIPEGWEVVEMSSVIKQINTGLNPRDNFILGNGKIKYITVKNLTEEGHIDFSNCDLVNSEAQKIIHERSQIQKGDILFASICPLGRCYLIQDSPEDWDINESVFSIRPNIDRITSEFLYTLLREAYYVKKMTQKATGSIFKGIRINDIEKIEIVLPPKEVINAFSKKALSIFNYQLTIQKEIQKLISMRDRLLPLLMNGQVEVE